MSYSAGRRLHHLAVGSRDVVRLASFYRDVLGLRERDRFYDAQGCLRSIWLDLLEGILMIERTDEPPRRVDGIGAGPFLVAFSVGPEERAELERALERAGASIESRSDFSSYARDPDGNRIAISHYPHERREPA